MPESQINGGGPGDIGIHHALHRSAKTGSDHCVCLLNYSAVKNSSDFMMCRM